MLSPGWPDAQRISLPPSWRGWDRVSGRVIISGPFDVARIVSSDFVPVMEGFQVKGLVLLDYVLRIEVVL